MLSYIYNFFRNEEKIIPKSSRIFLPLPDIGLRLKEYGGRVSLRFNLFEIDIDMEFNNEESDLLEEFYSKIIDLDRKTKGISRRIIDTKNLYSLFYRPRTLKLNNSLKRICNLDSNFNLYFNSKFLNIFETHKELAIRKILKRHYQLFRIREFEQDFPTLKARIEETLESKFNIGLTFSSLAFKDADISGGIGLEFIKYCSNHLYNKNYSKVISNIDKITQKGTNFIKTHIIKKMATRLDKFANCKKNEINNFENLFKWLLNSISYKNIASPFWFKNKNLYFFYYRTPSCIWNKYGKKNVSDFESSSHFDLRYKICHKIPILCNLDYIPRKWFESSDRNIYFASKGNTDNFPILEKVFSEENLSKANTQDKEFLSFFNIKIK